MDCEHKDDACLKNDNFYALAHALSEPVQWCVPIIITMCRPIHDAIEVGAFDLVKLLIRYGADPLAEQGEKTPAEFALEMEQPEIHAYLQGKEIACM